LETPHSHPRRITNAAEAADLLRPLLGEAQAEVIFVIHLSAKQGVLAVASYPRGADASHLPLREILGEALRLDAQGLVLAHDHPSGDATPSEQDLAAARTLADTARSMGIRLVDHLIFTGDQSVSLRGLGLL
jgi:DNA repair protein RadC